MAKPFTLKYETRRFNTFIRETTKNMTKGKVEFIEKIAADLISEIIDNTPVDTGRARAGWTAFADRVNLPYSISGPNVSADAISEGKSKSSFDITKTVDTASIRITNSVSYIQPLEFGHSNKAPAGMVRLAMRTIATGATGTAVDAIKKQIIAASNKANRTAKG